MFLDGTLPGYLEPGEIELAMYPAAELLDIDSRRAVEQRVEQQPLLHWREGIYVLDLAVRSDQAIKRLLIEFRHREVRRRAAARVGSLAVLDQGPKRLEDVLSQLLDRPAAVPVLTELEREPQAAVADQSAH